MGRTRCSNNEKLDKWIKEFGKNTFKKYSEYVSEGDNLELFCKFCEMRVVCDRKSQLEQHIKISTHKKRIDKQGLTQVLLPESFEKGKKQDTTSKFFIVSNQICELFLAGNISFNFASNPVFKKFIEMHCGINSPSHTYLQDTHLNLHYENLIEKIRADLKEEKIWVSIDASTDTTGRNIANIIVGKLNAERYSKPYLLDMIVLNKTNHSTITRAFNDSMIRLWPDGIQYDNVLFYVSDAGTYMTKSFESLHVLYPKMIHITYLAHSIHRVAEKIRSECPKIDKLISNGKKIFNKAPTRRDLFQELAPGLAFPPQPVLTRWGTWMEAVFYYSKNLILFREIVDRLDSEEAVAIKNVQKALKNQSLQRDLAYMEANFMCIPNLIQNLERADVEMTEVIFEFDSVTENLKKCQGALGNAVKTKVNYLKSKNVGFNQLLKIAKLIKGENIDCSSITNYSPHEIACFKYAPVTSCDVERSFSVFKNIFTDKRHKYKFENLKKVVMINYNM